MPDGVLVGIDVGTSAAKALVLDVDGSERSTGSAATPWEQVATGAELAPVALLEAVQSAVRQALSAVDAPVDVLGVGVASMAETGVLLGGDGRPVAPAVIWSDRRAATDGEALAADLGADEVARRTGLKTGPKLTAAVYRWLARNEPGIADGRCWLGVAEWIVHAFGGEAVAEPSLASRTGWLDLDRGNWWSEALAWSGIDASALPSLRPAGAPLGTAGLDPVAGAVLTVAGHDHQAAAVGAGATGPDDVLDSCGTAEALVRAVPAPVGAVTRERIVGAGLSVGRHVLGDRFAIIGGFPSGARLQRVLDALPAADREALEEAAHSLPTPPVVTLEELDALVEGSGDLLSKAARHGLTSSAAVWRAAAAAVARHGAQLLERIDELAGPSARVIVVGGWATSAVVAAAKEELLGRFLRPRVDEAGARGAAVLAGVAAGVYGTVEDAPPPQMHG